MKGWISTVKMCTLEEIHTANPSSKPAEAPSLSHKQLPFLKLQSLGHNKINFYYIMYILQRGGSAMVSFYNLISTRSTENLLVENLLSACIPYLMPQFRIF